ncbi:hypothetical protein [Streptomyces sp. NPDC015125]|uniref:hypothetical protein n=1 Tax=Streptomyces sp. NPDC015125 TaxID=3364938 RepID=UPI0037025759
MARMGAPCAAAPGCDDHRGPAVRVQQFDPLSLKHGARLDSEAHGKVGVGSHVAAFDVSLVMGPRGVRVGEGAHTYRVRHRESAAGLPFE